MLYDQRLYRISGRNTGGQSDELGEGLRLHRTDYGIGLEAPVTMWSLGRMEWLVVELVLEARDVLRKRRHDEDDPFWRVLEAKLHLPRSQIQLSMAFGPHKMRLLADKLEAAAAGAGARSDVLLLARPVGG